MYQHSSISMRCNAFYIIVVAICLWLVSLRRFVVYREGRVGKTCDDSVVWPQKVCRCLIKFLTDNLCLFLRHVPSVTHRIPSSTPGAREAVQYSFTQGVPSFKPLCYFALVASCIAARFVCSLRERHESRTPHAALAVALLDFCFFARSR